ncbi:MAG: GNAT family N-acetyltransferase [Oscillospiraceae bacterium]
MDIIIRRAEEKDAEKVLALLSQVLELHAGLRPDIFISGSTKYTAAELTEIFADDSRPVFVAEDGGEVVGYAFCVIKRQPFTTNMKDFTTLYIDDLCVDENCRGKHVGTLLFDYVMRFAKAQGCYDVTLNVWEGNDSARAFYEKMGMFVKETQMEILVK